MAVRVNQSVIEVVTLNIPNVRVCQSVLELVTLPSSFPVPSIVCNAPPGGTVGAAYSHAFPASGGTPPYTFQLIDGTIPQGTALDADTGVIAGTPTIAGTYTFTIRVTDSLLQSASVTCMIAIVLVISTIPQTIPGGGPPAILCPRPINLYDICAENEVRKIRKIKFPPSCTIPKNLLAWEEDGNPTPAQAIPFDVQGTIATPLPAAGDVLVCSGLVPTGYDGLLTSIYQIYEGSGMQQGNGDIIWRIRRNQVWLKQLGNNPYSVGKPTNPAALTEGEILFSGTRFSYYVNVPNLSGALQINGSSVSCGMTGFYWPRGYTSLVCPPGGGSVRFLRRGNK